MLKIRKTVTRAYIPAYRDRADAGRQIVEFVAPDPDPDAAVLAVPRGGVPVADVLAEVLGAPLDLVMARKLPIPDSPEAGFGAVALDGSLVLNDRLVQSLALTSEQIDAVVCEVRAEVLRRAREYRGNESLPDVAGRNVWVVDDGLASGYTMMAAAKMLSRQKPKRLTLCVPDSPQGSLDAVEPYFDEVHCLIAQTHLPFAVASFFEDFADLTDDEVRRILHRRMRSVGTAQP
jgi:putative phosphoribosyl transferase